jgi:transposase
MIITFSDRFRYYVYSQPCDMRKGYDGLSGLVSNEFKRDPLCGDVFVFLSRQRSKVKLLHWQGDGYCIYSKRLEKGTFELPGDNANKTAIEITPQQLQFILDGIVLSSVQKRARYEHHFVNKKAVKSSASTMQ